MKNQQGTSMVEVLVAIVLLSSSLLVSSQLQLRVLEQSAYNKAYAEARVLASQGIETTLASNKTFNALKSGKAEQLVGNNAVFTRSVQFGKKEKSSGVTYKMVDVNVSWYDQNKKQHSLALRSLISDRGNV